MIGGRPGYTFGKVTGMDGSEAVKKLSQEVAELRSHLASTTALRRMETAGAGDATAAVRGGGARDEARDAAMRKLVREVAELRMELSSVADKAGGVGGGGGGGGSEAVRKLSREVTELRSQLENARKEQAMTRTALRRMQDAVDDLTARVARP